MFDTCGAFDVRIMLLFNCDEAKLLILLLFASGVDVPVGELVDVVVGGVVGVTGGIWFKYSPLPITKTVDCESPPSSLADESSRAYLP